MKKNNRGSFKTSVLKEQPLQKAVLQAVGRKTAKAPAKPTGFCKRLSILFLLIFGVSAGVWAQQLTRFAVVDLSKVYTSFFRDSRAVREFEERSARVQKDIDRMTAEIQDIKRQQAEAELQGDREKALRLESDVYRRQEFLKEYYNLKKAELEDQRRKLTQSESFLEQVYAEIRYIAESEGYSMVLNLKDNTGILWYSPTVDITDKLIQNLTDKAKR